ncbi:uncharacterized protein LOC133190638 [Saccostrea echinata]|uniref:uncharacterized protein LOC133190638 n=1 Tax=Saccostrea echinata TaxID=191078 RepID=UPI002A841C2E|nr:uncharacterized protein LOC133190638 [Saccostrea echinata]
MTSYTISFENIIVHLDGKKLSGEIEIPCKESSTLSIRGCNKVGCSPESKILIPPYTEVVLPSRLIVEHQNTSSVDLTWFHRGGQFAVDIAWCVGKSGLFQCQDEIKFLRLNGTDNHTSISTNDINSRNDDVIFGVAIINDKQLSGGIKWQDACRYQKNLEPKKISGVVLLPDAPENSLIVSWSPVLCESSKVNNVYIHAYEIISCRLDSQNHCIGKENSEELLATHNTQHTLQNLHPDVKHGVWVRAKSLTKVGTKSDMVSGIPSNNDLGTGAVVGIIIAGIFVLVIMLAGGVCILRNVRSKLGLGETFPIHVPDLESEKSWEKFLTTPASYTDTKSANCISNQTKYAKGSVVSSNSPYTESDQCTSQERLLKCLTKNLPDQCPQANNTVLPLIDFPSTKDIDKENDNDIDQENDNAKIPEMLKSSDPTSSMSKIYEKENKGKMSREFLPSGYAKVLSPCLHEINRSPIDIGISTRDSPSYSNEIIQETVSSDENNIKQNEAHPNICSKEDINNISVNPQRSTDEESLNDQTINDECYVTNDASHWANESKLSVKNRNNVEHQRRSYLPSDITQSMTSAGGKGISSSLTNNMTDVNTNIIDDSYQKTSTPALNSDDYIKNDFLANDGVPNASKINNISIINTSINSSELSDHLSSNFCQNAEMCTEYVFNDTETDVEPSVKFILNAKQSPYRLPNDAFNQNTSEKNLEFIGYVPYSGVIERNF